MKFDLKMLTQLKHILNHLTINDVYKYILLRTKPCQ